MNNVLFLRQKQKMTQDEFAEYCDVSRISIARYETGSEVSRSNAKKIATACNVTVSFVIGDVGNEKTPVDDERIKEYFKRFYQLTPENKIRAEAYLEGLLSSQKK